MAIELDHPVTTAVIGKDVDFNAMKKRLGTRFRYRACGVGFVDHKGTKSKGVACTEVNIVPLNKCVDPKNPQTSFSPPINTLCIKWPKKDVGGSGHFHHHESQVCTEDFGNPVYAYEVDKFHHVVPHTQEIFCTTVGSPNVRRGTKCLDEHTVFCTFLPGPSFGGASNVFAWILAIARRYALG